MITLPYRFMLTGIVFAILGMCLGIWMGSTGPTVFNYAPVHAHINLVGWATMMLMGLWYRGAPQAAATTVASIHYWVALVGAVCLVLGIFGAVAPNPSLDLLVIPGSILTLLSMLLFLWIVWSEARKGV
jgi:hypothetical protein